MDAKRARYCGIGVALLVLSAGAGCKRPGGLFGSAKRDAGVRDLVSESLSPGYASGVDVRFEIDATRDRHPISPLIYCLNNDTGSIPQQRWALVRFGGNRATAYNWENNASNAGADWNFQNDALISESNEPAITALRGIKAANEAGAQVIVTLPNVDYVAADKNGDGDVRKSGPDYLSRRFRRNHARKPGPFSAVPDTNDGDVYQDEFVAYLRAKLPGAKLMFSMDNEPDLWSHTHAEVFPNKVTYDDLWRRNHEFASAAKDAWPDVPVLGFVSYGFTGFTTLQDASDANGREFLSWYLDQARAAQSKDGRRVIDYLDVHWYPEAQGGGVRVTAANNAPEVVRAREQAPRSLWDPNYREDSWITSKIGGPIALIPWLQTRIAVRYPGTKLAITEWNYGGGDHISGAIAAADVLGIYGRHGVDLACYWTMSNDEQFAFAGMRAYRNFDGAGAQFGDTSISAVSSDSDDATVYASVDSTAPTRTVVIAINKSESAKMAGFQVRQTAIYTKARVFDLTASAPVWVPGENLAAVATNTFRKLLPPQSITVLVMQE